MWTTRKSKLNTEDWKGEMEEDEAGNRDPVAQKVQRQQSFLDLTNIGKENRVCGEE